MTWTTKAEGLLSTLKKLKPKLGKGLFQGKIDKDMLDLGMFYFKTVSKHPRNPKHVRGEERKGRMEKSESEHSVNKKTRFSSKS